SAAHRVRLRCQHDDRTSPCLQHPVGSCRASDEVGPVSGVRRRLGSLRFGGVALQQHQAAVASARTGLSRRALLRGLGSLSASVVGLTLWSGWQFISPPASTPGRMRRVGYLYPCSRTFNQPSADAFVGKLRELGWTEGANLAIEWRFAEGQYELVPDLAAEL